MTSCNSAAATLILLKGRATFAETIKRREGGSVCGAQSYTTALPRLSTMTRFRYPADAEPARNCQFVDETSVLKSFVQAHLWRIAMPCSREHDMCLVILCAASRSLRMNNSELDIEFTLPLGLVYSSRLGVLATYSDSASPIKMNKWDMKLTRAPGIYRVE